MPGKVSHHIHRIGYSFPVDIVAQGCQELEYVVNNGKFVSVAELQRNNIVARTLARHGVQHPAPEETTERIAMTIKELFPKIPQHDLDMVLKHAWKKGTDRVGNASDMDLVSRVQYAVCASVRHEYTDYDMLLRSLGWAVARHSVEADIVAKLKEWRGEDDQVEDDDLIQILRETIVIEDDSDDDLQDHNGDVESSADVDAGYTTDTSLIVVHNSAAVEDVGAERHDERSIQFLERHQPRHKRNFDPRHKVLQQNFAKAVQRDRHSDLAHTSATPNQ